MNSSSSQKGVAALLVVVVILALLLSIGLVVTRFALNELSLTSEADQSNRALQIAEACADEAVYRLKLDSGYAGGSLSLSGGDCTVAVAGGGSTRTLTITSTYLVTTRNLTLTVDLLTNNDTTAEGTAIDNWQED